jgi:hypothetical protein
MDARKKLEELLLVVTTAVIGVVDHLVLKLRDKEIETELTRRMIEALKAGIIKVREGEVKSYRSVSTVFKGWFYKFPLDGVKVAFSPDLQVSYKSSDSSGVKFHISVGLTAALGMVDISQIIEVMPYFKEVYEKVIGVRNGEEAVKKLADEIRAELDSVSKEDKHVIYYRHIAKEVVYKDDTLVGKKEGIVRMANIEASFFAIDADELPYDYEQLGITKQLKKGLKNVDKEIANENLSEKQVLELKIKKVAYVALLFYIRRWIEMFEHYLRAFGVDFADQVLRNDELLGFLFKDWNYKN